MRNLLGLIAFLSVISLQAQNYSIITGGSIADAEKITKAYLAPMERGLGYAGSNGIINFTTSDRKISFNIGMSITAALTPKDQRTYNINSLGLVELRASDPNNYIAQSISGSGEQIGLETNSTYYRPSLVYPFYKEIPLATFDSPSGSDLPIMPSPIFRAGIYGFGTHLNFKILPNFNTNKDARIVFYGVDFQHNLSTFIPKMKEWPVQLAFAAGYEFSHLEYFLDIKPDDSKFGIVIGDNNGPYDNQEVDLKITSIPMQLIAYHDFSGLTLYGGIGYNITYSDVALKGNFPVYAVDPTDKFKITVNDIVNPYQYTRSYDGFRVDLGLNYQIGFMKFMASYSFSRYQVFHMGIGVNI